MALAFDPSDQQIRDICLAVPLFRQNTLWAVFCNRRQTYAGKLQFAFKGEVASLVLGCVHAKTSGQWRSYFVVIYEGNQHFVEFYTVHF
jgi:hypothetical protein